MRLRLIFMALGLSLLLAASAQAGPLFSSTTTRVVDIHFTWPDGTPYCDGAHMTINYNTGLVIGSRIGCGHSEPLWGTVGTVLNGTYKGGAVTFVDATYIFYVVILDNPKKWVYYNADGSIFNSGTYHVGAPDLDAQGAGPSFVKK